MNVSMLPSRAAAAILIGIALPGCGDDAPTSGARSEQREIRVERVEGEFAGRPWVSSTSTRGREVCVSVRYGSGSGGGCASSGDGEPRLFLTELRPARFVTGIVGSDTRSVEVVVDGRPPRVPKLYPARAPDRPGDEPIRYFVVAGAADEPLPIIVRQHLNDGTSNDTPLTKGPSR